MKLSSSEQFSLFVLLLAVILFSSATTLCTQSHSTTGQEKKVCPISPQTFSCEELHGNGGGMITVYYQKFPCLQSEESSAAACKNFNCSSYECASSGDVIIQDCLLSSEEIKNFQCINSSDASQLWCVRSQTDSGKARMFWDFSIVFFVLSLFGCAYYFGLRCINFFSEK